MGSREREQGPRLVRRPPANTRARVRGVGWPREVLSRASLEWVQSAS
jgi:hypothetical protein